MNKEQQQFIDTVKEGNYTEPECRECNKTMERYDNLFRCGFCGYTITIENYESILINCYFNKEPEENWLLN